MVGKQDGRLRAQWRRRAKTFALAATSAGIGVLAAGAMVGIAAADVRPAERGSVTAPTAGAFSSVAAGYGHTCAIRTDGTLWCWGSNYSGELGDGTNTSHTTPARVGDATTWASIDGGTSYNCAVRTDGTLWCWGSNSRGQL